MNRSNGLAIGLLVAGVVCLAHGVRFVLTNALLSEPPRSVQPSNFTMKGTTITLPKTDLRSRPLPIIRYLVSWPGCASCAAKSVQPKRLLGIRSIVAFAIENPETDIPSILLKKPNFYWISARNIEGIDERFRLQSPLAVRLNHGRVDDESGATPIEVFLQ